LIKPPLPAITAGQTAFSSDGIEKHPGLAAPTVSSFAPHVRNSQLQRKLRRKYTLDFSRL
jgi:hypothetical protein